MVESDHSDSRFPIDILSLRRFLVRAQREVPLDGEVNVRITSSEEMHRLNREFRRKNEPTDVLSFPSSLNGKSEPAGDIAISAEIAYANAGALGHPLEEELKVLILHGLLHLAGYDHESDRGKMARKEARLRAKLKLPTTLIERAIGGELRGSSSSLSRAKPARRHP
jgi:probable rRNA maturation factor